MFPDEITALVLRKYPAGTYSCFRIRLELSTVRTKGHKTTWNAKQWQDSLGIFGLGVWEIKIFR